MDSICIHCGAVLVDANWWPSNRKINKLVCNSCVNERMLPIYRAYHERQRLKALDKVANGSEIKCVNCGCEDKRLLEINHKDGGGIQELGKGNERRHMKFYQDIITGKRQTDDLEITCRVCNALHYLQLKHGDLPFKVIWFGSTA